MSAWDVDVRRCDILSNYAWHGGGGIYVSDALRVTVSACNIMGNLIAGVFVQGDPAEPVHAAGNWWGDASGPHHFTLNPDGAGDSASGNVEFEPWRVTPVGEDPPSGVAFQAIVPNPFASSTCVEYSLDSPSLLSLTVYDASGRLVTTLFDGPCASGVHAAVWDGRDARGAGVASGVYFLRLEADSGQDAARAVVLR